MELPKTVALKAEALDEEGVWCACTVETVEDEAVIVSFDGWSAEWNRRICDPREIRDRTLPDGKRKRTNLSRQVRLLKIFLQFNFQLAVIDYNRLRTQLIRRSL